MARGTSVSNDKLSGCLLGTAVGDALGLPREGLSRRRAGRFFGDVLEYRLVFGRGMWSDDTEHACMLGQAWLGGAGDIDRFRRSLARRLKLWLLGLPAGVGLGTARAIVKLWFFVPPERSGVRSAGNGPAMRSPLLGLLVEDDAELRAWTRASTRITHTDPRAERAAHMVALAAREGARCGPGGVSASAFIDVVSRALPDEDEELAQLLDAIRDASARGDDVATFARAIGVEDGVSGYAYRTVPVALYAWLSYPGDIEKALTEAIALGGDTDTVGAITGALVGATAGAEAIPARFIDGLLEAPRTVAWIRRLAARLETGGRPVPLAWPLLLPRNLFFLAVVLAHGFRRLLPPY